MKLKPHNRRDANLSSECLDAIIDPEKSLVWFSEIALGPVGRAQVQSLLASRPR
jgi:hypothetical protein